MNRSATPWVRPIVAILASALFFVPLYLVCVNVIKHGDLIAKEPAALPIPPTLHNLKAVLTRSDNLFLVSLTNSVIVTVLSVLVLTVLAALLGHYLARNRSSWSRALTLVLFNVGYYVPLGVFVFTGFIRSVPIELEEAAVIDGASRMQVFWRIVFPLLRPATASVLIFLSVWIWNDFIDPLIILGPSQGTTVTTGLYRAIGQYQVDLGSGVALMFLASLPVLIFYLALQKHFVKGLTGGATKG